MRVYLEATALLIVVLVSGCVRSESELLEVVEASIRSDPFIRTFSKSLEHSFGCESESETDSQLFSVYSSLNSLIVTQPEAAPTHFPSVHVDVRCSSHIISRVFLDLELYRGGVLSFDQFESIKPQMIARIRFEPPPSFAWSLSESPEVESDLSDLPDAAISTRIWKDFAIQITSMFRNGCHELEESAVFFSPGEAMMYSGMPYQDFVSVLSCRIPTPGPLTPGFKFKGRYFPTKGVVLPLEIEFGGAYE